MITVLMSVYNGERYLAESIESMLKQTYADFEFLIINDGSTDATSDILQQYTQQDSRIRLLENAQNIGLTRSLNLGLQAATGKYIARQDADDISLPNRLQEQHQFLNENPEVVLVSGNVEIIDEEGNTTYVQQRSVPPQIVHWYMLFYNHVGGHGQVMYQREAALAVGGYAEDHRYSQDYDLWLRLMKPNNIAILPHVWLKLRWHSESISQQRFDKQEQLSLTDSQIQIEKLIGENLSLEELAVLRAFWLEPFPDVVHAPATHERLKQIYLIYVRKYELSPTLKGQLRQAIGMQFIKWGRSVSIRRKPIQKFVLARYGLAWQPVGQMMDWIKHFA